jgi:hypothetical protein
MEAASRFELENKGFADLCLTAWLSRHFVQAFKAIRRIKANHDSPLHLSVYLYIWANHNSPFNILLERKTRFELATLALARRCSTTELLPLFSYRRFMNRLLIGMVPRAGIEPATRGFSTRLPLVVGDDIAGFAAGRVLQQTLAAPI